MAHFTSWQKLLMVPKSIVVLHNIIISYTMWCSTPLGCDVQRQSDPCGLGQCRHKRKRARSDITDLASRPGQSL